MGYFEFEKEEKILGNRQMYGACAAITDFSIVLGGTYANDQFVNDKEILKNRAGYYYTGSFTKKESVRVIGPIGRVISQGFTDHMGARPSLLWDITAPPLEKMSKTDNIVITVENGIKKYECFEFPQSVVSDETAEELEDEFWRYIQGVEVKTRPRQFGITGKMYTFPFAFFKNKKFKQEKLAEYEYDDRKYVRVVTDGLSSTNYILSNGKYTNAQRVIWIEVEPIVWLIDNFGHAITEKIIFAGVPFEKRGRIKGNFDKNTIGQYMKNYFSVDIIPSQGVKAKRNYDYEYKEEKNNEESILEDELDRTLAYNFDFDNVSEEELIRGCIESNIAVFLHGKSSDGKSARVKQIDPNCEIVYLRNATPDSLNGKSVYNEEKGEMIDVPPTWYKKIKDKCDNEPNKLHIVFFDELTNALPSIQGMAFNIILDKEVNGVWKLPDNCRIVAAGNDLEDSLAANQMAEPLFNRFSHVYIDTTVDKWLKWAARKESNIHPAIYTYVAYKSCCKSDVLRTTFDGKKPNADPRKWEMASKVLYTTKNPEMLRSLIGSPLTEDFVAFCEHSVITLDDVINNNYSDSDINEMGLDEKFATSIGLSKCEDKDLEVVRAFVAKLGAEVLATFDVLCNYRKGDKTLSENKLANKR